MQQCMSVLEHNHRIEWNESLLSFEVFHLNCTVQIISNIVSKLYIQWLTTQISKETTIFLISYLSSLLSVVTKRHNFNFLFPDILGMEIASLQKYKGYSEEHFLTFNENIMSFLAFIP